MGSKIIQRRDVQRDYGFWGVDAIIEHPTHGRVLIRDGFGGRGNAGWMVRWECGIGVKLRPGDTLESLESEMHNDWTTVRAAAEHGYDPLRPVMPWDGTAVRRVAKAAGL
jgi:hypothetical protein